MTLEPATLARTGQAPTNGAHHAEQAEPTNGDCRAEQARINGARRAEQARINGAKSRGAVTPEGKARSARNACKHGLCAEGPIDEEGRAALDALEAELAAEWRPESALDRALVLQMAHALWRIGRADAIEVELLTEGLAIDDDTRLTGTEIFADPAGQRALALLLRYRGAAERQLRRAQRMLEDRRRPAPADAFAAGVPAMLRAFDRMDAARAPSAKRTERADQPEHAPGPAAPLNRRERRRLAALERRLTG